MRYYFVLALSYVIIGVLVVYGLVARGGRNRRRRLTPRSRRSGRGFDVEGIDVVVPSA